MWGQSSKMFLFKLGSLIEKEDPIHLTIKKLHEGLVRQSHKAVIGRAFAKFSQLHSEEVDSLFDEHFLNHSAAPILAELLKGKSASIAEDLVIAWDTQLGPASTSVRKRRIEQFTPVAEAFLSCLYEQK